MHYDVAVLGATGMVGQKFIQLLEGHPWFKVKSLAASERRAGKKYGEEVIWLVSEEVPKYVRDIEMVQLNPKYVDADIVFSALPSNIAREAEPKFASEGFVVASNASAFRMEKDVPLIIPEVNSDHLGLINIQKKNRGWEGYIITNPNCTTIILTLSLKPLMKFGINSVKVATMQAISGAGFLGVPSFAIEDNIIPFIKGEEEKVESETLKILGKLRNGEISYANISISASCHRVPVTDGHLESVWVEFTGKVDIEEIKSSFEKLAPIKNLPTSPNKVIIVRSEVDRPQPRLDRNSGNGMSIVVGRIRKDTENSVKYLVLGHNTVRGAAGASILNAELLVAKKYI
ncbi:aspartate-semialdehyde dehydrogenase [Archaeoglobales archaeon ex4484_92]|nr:MAG: aspartate-semialdehyde dehydrogenase [Archaeoglobales archaeon ex4484_92]